MVLTNFSDAIYDFENHSDPNWHQQYKTYTLGLMFDSQVIQHTIEAISASFFRTFTFYFVLPYMLLVMVMIAGEIL